MVLDTLAHNGRQYTTFPPLDGACGKEGNLIMPKRTQLSNRKLPNYSQGEEVMNMVTHIVGGSFGIAALVLCVIRAATRGGVTDVVAAAIYGASLICLYTMSSVYHGLRPGTGKKVLQILDHCTIYFLIAGSYTPVALAALLPHYPALGIGLCIAEWGLTALAATFTAIDLRNYRVFSMICYIGMGWAVLPFIPQTIRAMGQTGFALLLAGGIAYTVGAILYGIGVKIKWLHSVFHLFVVLGSVLHFFAIFFYALP